MHRALFVLEILMEIFSHLNPISPESCTVSRESRKSLAALARTCKTFHDRAMDLLWAVLDDVWPLLGCVTRLHPSIYDGDNDHGSDDDDVPYRGLKRPLSLPDPALFSGDEARQFLRHAARVRSLSVYDSYILWFLNSDFPTGTCLFPRLFSLSWKVQLPMNHRLLHLFLSPTLCHCYLTTIDCDWKFITTHCTVLETLSIMPSNVIPAADVIFRLSDTIRSYNRLVKLCCPMLDSAAWKHISNLPTLVSLEINGPGACTELFDWNDFNLAPFLNLTDLSLSLFFAIDAVDITTLIQRSEFPSLKEFELHSNHVPWEQVEQIFRALSRCKACQTLEGVSLSFHDPEYQDDVDNPLPVIRQFLCFTQLRHLSLFFNDSIDLDNNLLLEAVSRWPHIELLNFENTHQSAVTFRGLFAALHLCPHLHTLRIYMDAVNIDIDPTAKFFQHRSLYTLDFTLSVIGDAKRVAAIIAARLPCVRKVAHTHTAYNGTTSWEWKQVNIHLQSLWLLKRRNQGLV